MAAGIVFGLALFVTATFRGNPWEDHTYGLAPPILADARSPHVDGREKMVCSSCHIVVPRKTLPGQSPAVLPIVQGTPAPHRDGREALPCAECHTIIPRGKTGTVAPPSVNRRGTAALPHALTVAMERGGGSPAEAHEAMVPFRFQGHVAKIAGSGQASQWGDLYVLVDDAINPPYWIDLAPRWFLAAGGCHFQPGVFVKGTAARDPMGGEGALVFAKSIMVAGEVCALRDNHLRGLWGEIGGGDGEER